MQYISKGMLRPGSSRTNLTVNIRGADHQLRSEYADVWLTVFSTLKSMSLMSCTGSSRKRREQKHEKTYI